MPRLRYQQQDSTQTLAEGLAEYYVANGDKVTRPRDLPEESAKLFRSHDMCHVIFGLDTTIQDEAMADTRTILSCDVGVRRYVDYLRTDAQAKALFKQIGIWTSIITTLQVLPRILRAIAESWRMKKRWPWVPPESFFGRPLAELRREFGIRLI
jgi:ubiquinone biosynthesis protein Coq4